MKHVGFMGGSSMFELDSPKGMMTFFEKINEYVSSVDSNDRWLLLTDRLYRRYVKMEDLDETARLLIKVRSGFSLIRDIELGESSLGSEVTLGDTYSRYFDAFDHCMESAKIFFASWGVYQAVRVVVTDVPDFMVDKKRPLADYDSLEGLPFWAR